VRQATDHPDLGDRAPNLATTRAIYAKPKPVSPSAQLLEKLDRASYQQMCSACCGSGREPSEINYKLNGTCACGGWNCPQPWAAKLSQSAITDTPVCGLCAGNGYITGNESARGGSQRDKVNVDAEWRDAGFYIVHGATGNPVGRPRHNEATLKPATVRKRRSRPLKDRSEVREFFSSTDRARWNLEKWERGTAQARRRSLERPRRVGLPWAMVPSVTNTPTSEELSPKFRFPSLVAVGTPQDLAAFWDVYEVYESEIPSDTHDYRKGQSPSTAELSAAFARLVDQEPSWTWEPMHAAVERLRPRDRRDAAARKDHYWLVQTLNWRGGPCACSHVDVIAHLAESGSNPNDPVSASYIARVVLEGARVAYDLANASVAV
jgi:hypothetical protein